MGSHALLQGIFLTQGSNLLFLHLLHWQAGSLPLVAQYSVKITPSLLPHTCFFRTCVFLVFGGWIIDFIFYFLNLVSSASGHPLSSSCNPKIKFVIHTDLCKEMLGAIIGPTHLIFICYQPNKSMCILINPYSNPTGWALLFMFYSRVY